MDGSWFGDSYLVGDLFDAVTGETYRDLMRE